MPTQRAPDELHTTGQTTVLIKKKKKRKRSNFNSREFNSRELFRFLLVITRHQAVGIRSKLGEILPTDLPDLSKASGSSKKPRKIKI